LVEALARQGLVRAADGAAELVRAPVGVPDSLTKVIELRLGHLTKQAAHMLRVAALLGSDFDVTDLALVVGEPVTAITEVVDEAISGGVLLDAGDRLVFRHDLIRQVLLEQTPQAVRNYIHRHIARVLAEAGRGVDAVAAHLLQGPETFDAWALEWVSAAPESTLYSALNVSAELLTRAVKLTDEGDPRWEILADKLAQVLFWSGSEQAVDVAAKVARRTADVERAAGMRILVIRAAGRSGRAAEALWATISLPDDEALPQMWRARLGAWSALVFVIVGRAEDARAVALDALARAEQCGDALATGYAHHVLARLESRIHGALPMLEHIEHALAALGDDPESMDLRMLLIQTRLAAMIEMQMPDADTELARALVVAERIGSFRAAAVLSTAAEFCYMHGRWDEALQHIDTIDRSILEGTQVGHLHGLAALIALHRDEHDSAAAHLNAAKGLVLTDSPQFEARVTELMDALALQAEAAGDPDDALRLRATWLDLPPGIRRHERLEQAPDLVRVALLTGKTDIAAAAAAACRADVDADADVMPGRIAAARCCRAMIDDDTAELLAVAETYRQHDRPREVGFVLEEAAARLARNGDTEQARAAFADAIHAYRELGAAWDLRRAEARLRPHGIRRGRRGAQRRAVTGWEALTPAEERITYLIGNGLSNADIAIKLFVSRNTVQTHVSNILRKLQLRSRIEIAREIARRST
jgi:DNA-binding NarL/FixJ family response regulator